MDMKDQAKAVLLALDREDEIDRGERLLRGEPQGDEDGDEDEDEVATWRARAKEDPETGRVAALYVPLPVEARQRLTRSLVEQARRSRGAPAQVIPIGTAKRSGSAPLGSKGTARHPARSRWPLGMGIAAMAAASFLLFQFRAPAPLSPYQGQITLFPMDGTQFLSSPTSPGDNPAARTTLSRGGRFQVRMRPASPVSGPVEMTAHRLSSQSGQTVLWKHRGQCDPKGMCWLDARTDDLPPGVSGPWNLEIQIARPGMPGQTISLPVEVRP